MFYREKKDPLQLNQFKYVIIDTDMGCDDAQAILLIDYFVRKQGKVLLGIVCTSGNVKLVNGQKNALICQSVCKSQYPIYLGSSTIFQEKDILNTYFGNDGLGQMQSQYIQKHKIYSDFIRKQKAYKFIADSAVQYKGDISIVCIGPLTNLALAYHYNNKIKECFSNIVIMGCADNYCGFYQNYLAEYNIGADPQASYIVFQRFKNIVVVSFDTTCMNIDTNKTIKLFEYTQTAKGKFIYDIHQHFIKQSITPTVVDPLAVLTLFKPDSVLQGMNTKISINVKGVRTRGSSTINYFCPMNQYNSYLIKQFNIDTIIEEIMNSYNQ